MQLAFCFFLSSLKRRFFRSTWPPAVTQCLCFESHPADSDPPLFVMAFRQQLARNSVNVHQAWLAEIKDKFMKDCEKASRSGHCSYWRQYETPAHCNDRREREFLRQQGQELLVELGFPEGKLTWLHDGVFRLEVEWSPEDATCSIPEPQPQTNRGFCTTCPICQEHRPVVVLVPCGHVICGDCHRCQQLRQCPMCRGPITSATNGLFMDWREHRGQWWHRQRWMDLDRFLPLPFKAKIEKILQFWRFLRWAVAVGWLGSEENFCKMHVEQGAWHFPQMEFCKNQLVHFDSMSPHLIPRIIASWSFLCGMVVSWSFPNVEQDLVNIPFTAAKSLQCHPGCIAELVRI